MVAEFIGGLLTGSLALLADAGHMLSDVLALAMSAAAVQISRLPPTPQRTYGYQRTEILAALGHGNGTLLREIADLLVERFGISHSTIQIEPENFQEPDSASCD
ncbi:MAG: cation transporter [Deltaproteobacteria bacterium]|nr:cation transporter [Deltaproteobacteria bacterium]